MSVTIYRKTDIRKITGLADSTIERMEKAGVFPARVKLNPYGRSVGWLSGDVDAWLVNRTAVNGNKQSGSIGDGLPGPGRGRKKSAAAA